MNTIEEIVNIDTWKKMNPHLSITSKHFLKQPLDFNIDRQDAEHYFKKLTKEGYLNTKPIIPEEEVNLIAEAIEKIHSLGLPPIFMMRLGKYLGAYQRLLNEIPYRKLLLQSNRGSSRAGYCTRLCRELSP